MDLKKELNHLILLDLTFLILKEVSNVIYILASFELQMPYCVGGGLGQILKMGEGHNVEFDMKMLVLKTLCKLCFSFCIDNNNVCNTRSQFAFNFTKVLILAAKSFVFRLLFLIFI